MEPKSCVVALESPASGQARIFGKEAEILRRNCIFSADPSESQWIPIKSQRIPANPSGPQQIPVNSRSLWAGQDLW